MPRRPMKPCSFPGCPKLCEGTYCEEHQAQVYREYDRYVRTKEERQRYTGRWPKIRERYAMSHPFCEICYAAGVLTPTEIVHHRLPLAEGGTNADDNLQALCKACHGRLHTERGDYLKPQ